MERERKEEILEKLQKASSEEYETSWDEKGVPISKKKAEIAKGKKSRAKGLDFESVVRKDMEEKGWVVCKWANNVDLEARRVIPAKRKFNPFNKVMTLGTGFPDFFCFQKVGEKTFNIIGVEVKVGGYLDKEEKEKCKFLLDKQIFNDIWIARKTEEGEISYITFSEKYAKEKTLD
jgi:hypothetical protein